VVLVEALQKPTGTGEQTSAPAAEAGIFLPPEGFAEGAVNFGGFDLFDETGQFQVEEYRKVEKLLKAFYGEDIRQWVTPDHKQIYVAVRVGAESRTTRQRREDELRQLGRTATQS